MRASLVSLVSAMAFSGAMASDVSITDVQFDYMKLYAQYASAGYCNYNNTVGQNVICGANTCPDVEAGNTTTLVSFQNEQLLGTNIAGLVALNPAAKLIAIIFRGSLTIRNWIADFDFVQETCDFATGCAVHSGFNQAWNEVSTVVTTTLAAAVAANPDYNIVVTGHSLGGAVATIAGATLRQAGYSMDIYTYGSPRVGNKVFADFVTAQAGGAEYRVTHLDDPVPRLPPLLMNYYHVSPEYWLHGGNSSSTDYTLYDVEVCPGVANLSCNAQTTGLDVTAHRYYLEYITGCGPTNVMYRRGQDGINSRRSSSSSSANVTDQELEARVDMFRGLDMQYRSSGCSWSGVGGDCPA